MGWRGEGGHSTIYHLQDIHHYSTRFTLLIDYFLFIWFTVNQSALVIYVNRTGGRRGNKSEYLVFRALH